MPIEYRLAPGGKTNAGHAEPGNVLWIDAISPTDSELDELDKMMGFEVPNRHDIGEIELSNRLYKEEGALVMIASLLPKTPQKLAPPRPAAFILRHNLLLTIRYCEFFSFERVATRPFMEDDEHTATAVFCRLLEEAVADRADNIEFSMRHMEILATQLFHPAPGQQESNASKGQELDDALRSIGIIGESVSNIRESITSLQRAVNYAYTYIPEAWIGEQRPILDSLRSDLLALSDEASFFMNKLSFNLDATLGMINIEENKIIRLLSVVTLLLSPPTLIAGIYGMNFQIMPELTWPFGYAFSISLMVTTAIMSIWYLKRKRWM